MAKHRSIILVCSMILVVATVYSAPLKYTRTGRESRAIRLPEEQDCQKTSRRRVTRQVRDFSADKGFEESSTVSHIIPEGIEGQETARKQAKEEMRILAEEMPQTLKEDERNGSSAAELRDGKFVCETFVGTTKRRNMVMSEDVELIKTQRKERESEYNKRRKEHLRMVRLDNPEAAEAHRKKQRKYNESFIERRRVARLENPKAAETQRKYWRESKQRGRERMKVAALGEPELMVAQRKRRAEYEKHRRERQKVENPEAAEATRKKQLEYCRRYRERKKAAMLEDRKLTENNSAQSRC